MDLYSTLLPQLQSQEPTTGTYLTEIHRPQTHKLWRMHNQSQICVASTFLSLPLFQMQLISRYQSNQILTKGRKKLNLMDNPITLQIIIHSSRMDLRG
jgi:hypothetical protein